MTVVNKEFKIIVGERLRELRKSKKWTINYLLEKLSSECYITIDEKTVRRYEAGEILPKIDNLIAAFLMRKMFCLIVKFRIEIFLCGG